MGVISQRSDTWGSRFAALATNAQWLEFPAVARLISPRPKVRISANTRPGRTNTLGYMSLNTCLYASLVGEGSSPDSHTVKSHLLQVILNQLVSSTPAFYIIKSHTLTIAGGALTLAVSHFQPSFVSAESISTPRTYSLRCMQFSGLLIGEDIGHKSTLKVGVQ